jgi:predicted outer membrane repeat protein
LLSTWTVTDSTDDPADTGSLRYAILNAPSGTTINFAATVAATVKGPIALTHGALNITTNLDIEGPGAGRLTIDGNKASTVFIVSRGVTATIAGLAIEDGSGASGGGIDNGGTLTVTKCDLGYNSAKDSGGGIFSRGTLTVTDCALGYNSARYSGGGIDSRGMLTVVNSRVSNNKAARGGGIYDEYNGTVTLTGATLLSNSADQGGGIYEENGTVTLTSSTVSSNSAGNKGGGIYEYNGTLTLISSTVARNSAIDSGGGIYSTGTVTLTNATVSGNSAALGDGGGIYGRTVTLTNATVSGNSASQGGGVAANSGTVRSVRLANTIVARNGLTDPPRDGPNVSGVVDSLGHNLIDDTSGSHGWVASDLLNVDPRLAPLGDYGGPTPTMALLVGSPALDGGEASIPGVSVPTLDQRGAIRGRAGLNAGAAPDIGAFEASSSYLVTPAADSKAVGTLRAAVGWANVNVNNNKEDLKPESAAPNTIVFDTKGDFSTPQTITLTGRFGPLTLTNTSTPEAIDGPGASILTVSGGGQVPVLFVSGRGVTATIAGITITHGSGGFGGGIVNLGSTLTLTNSTVSYNSASASGGGIYSVGGELTVTDSTVSNNSAGSSIARGDGGGIYNENGTLTLTNSTLANNSAGGFGGGISNLAKLTLTNCTVAGNSAGQTATKFSVGQGGGLWNGPTGKATLANTIIAGNRFIVPTDKAGKGPDVYGDFDSLGHNLIGDTSDSSGWLGTDLLGVDPRLAPLDNYGGPTPTMALLAGSPALDAGSASIPGVTVPTLDQRGALRGPAGLNAGPAPDIGAFEASSSYLVTTAADSNDVGTLRAAVGWANVNRNNNEQKLASKSPAPNTIVFDTRGAFGAPQTITLSPSLGALTLTNTSTPVTIDGPGASILTVSGGNQVEVVHVIFNVTATIAGLTIARGHSGSYGGGIFNEFGRVTLSNSTVSSSSAEYGGGIKNLGTMTITNSTLSNNSADQGGGIQNLGTLTITNSTVSNNSAGGFGGGISNSATLTLTNCTLSNNVTRFDGGGVSNVGMVTLTNATLSGNSAANGGGFWNGPTGKATLANTIIAGNSLTGSGAKGPDVNGHFNSLGHNLIGDTSGSSGWLKTDLLGVDPRLAPLGNNGGPTQTMALLAGSPAIDAGDVAFVTGPPFPGPPFTDQRGAPRIKNGTVDIGAVES